MYKFASRFFSVSLFLCISHVVAFSAPKFARPKAAPAAKTSLDATNRRGFVVEVATATAFMSTSTPLIARAANTYVPKFDDIKTLFMLATSLDMLSARVSDPEKWESALGGLRSFNMDARFYPGYAKNFISKSVKKNADGDPRLAYVREACTMIGSIEELLEGRESLQGSAAALEGVKRIEKSQQLLAKFFLESGVEDSQLTAYIAAHK